MFKSEQLDELKKKATDLLNAIFELEAAPIEEEDVIGVYNKLADVEAFMVSSVTRLGGFKHTLSVLTDVARELGVRYYICEIERYGQKQTVSLQALGKASGTCWHDLSWAAGALKRRTEIEAKGRFVRSGKKPPVYTIIAYSAAKGRITRVPDNDIQEAMKKYEKRTEKWRV